MVTIFHADRGVAVFGHAKTIRLTGDLDRATAGELLEHCRGLADRGTRTVVIDLSAVRRCDRAGMVGLDELRTGWCGLTTRLTGARWSQFFPAMQAADLGELSGVREQVRSLVEAPAAASVARPVLPRPRHEPFRLRRRLESR